MQRLKRNEETQDYVKNQDKTLETVLNAMEISDLLDRDFKKIVSFSLSLREELMNIVKTSIKRQKI